MVGQKTKIFLNITEPTFAEGTEKAIPSWQIDEAVTVSMVEGCYRVQGDGPEALEFTAPPYTSRHAAVLMWIEKRIDAYMRE